MAMKRVAVEKELEGARKVLRQVEGDRDAISGIIEELRAKKDPAAVATLPKRKAQEQRLEDDLINFNIGTHLERLRDAEITVQTALGEVARLEGELARCDRVELADKLERLGGQLHEDRKAIDETMQRLAELFRAEAATRARIGRLDREAGEDQARAFRNMYLPRMACIKAGLPSFVPVDHVSNSRGGMLMASWPEHGLEHRIAELRADPKDVAA
jgi:hypothetical protein